jgi:hypothetical protein
MISAKELEKILDVITYNYYVLKLGFKGKNGVYKNGDETVNTSIVVYPGCIHISPKFKKNFKELAEFFGKFEGREPMFEGLIYPQCFETVLLTSDTIDEKVKNSKSQYFSQTQTRDNLGFPSLYTNYNFVYEEGVDIKDFMEEHIYFYENYIKPFFSKFNSIEDLHNYYNDDVTNTPLEKVLDPEFVAKIAKKHRNAGYKYAVIVARILNVPNIEELISKYKKIYDVFPKNNPLRIQLLLIKKVYGNDYLYLVDSES